VTGVADLWVGGAGDRIRQVIAHADRLGAALRARPEPPQVI
jgi:hypothetical protein